MGGGFDSEDLVLHVGPPRTGTTTLQLDVFRGHDEIDLIGKPFDAPLKHGASAGSCEAMAALSDMLWREDGIAFCFDRARALLTAAADRPRRSGARVRVLSEEGFGHNGAVDAHVIAKRLRRLFGRCRVLVTVREPVSAAVSYYRWAYTRGFAEGSLDSWVRARLRRSSYFGRGQDFPLANARYGALVELYQRLFGVERVMVLPLEMLRSDRAAYAGALSGFLGVDGDQIAALLDHPAKNASVGRLEAGYQRLVKRWQYARARRSGQIFTGRPPSHLVSGGVHGPVLGLIRAIDGPQRGLGEAARGALERYYAPDQALLLRALARGGPSPEIRES